MKLSLATSAFIRAYVQLELFVEAQFIFLIVDTLLQSKKNLIEIEQSCEKIHSIGMRCGSCTCVDVTILETYIFPSY